MSLTTRIRFTRAEFGEDKDWKSDTRNHYGRRLELCELGPETWFEIPPGCNEIWVVIEPYPHEEAYRIYETPIILLLNPSDPQDGVSFYSHMSVFIRDLLDQHPEYNFYFSIEVTE